MSVTSLQYKIYEMGTPHGNVNTTRLSLDIADLPLTPFGMSPRGSPKKQHIYPSQRTNKLSLKSFKPSQENGLTSNFQREENKTIVSSYNINFRPKFSRISIRNTPKNLHTLDEHHSIDFQTDSFDIHDPLHLESSEAIVNSQVFSGAAVTDKVPNHRRIIRESRESLFTDIDDGSFIEFYHGKENGHCVPKLTNAETKCAPQLYYTCESQNETRFSTSTKVNNVLVGFRKYVEAVRKQKNLQSVIEETESKMSKFPIKKKTFNYDETIITCSADIKKCRPKMNFKDAANSTIMDKLSNQVQIPRPVFPNISTLSVPSDVVSSSDSGNPTPDKSPMYFQRKATKNAIQTINISESSEEEFKIISGLNEKQKVILRNQENYNTSTQRAVLWSQEMYGHSHLSEDVSIVSSTPPLRQQPHKVAKGNKINQGNLGPSSLEKGAVCVPVKQHTKVQILCELNPIGAAAPDKSHVVTSEKAKSPVVAKWIISSPFKDSSFGTSFVHKKSNFHCDDPSSPAKLAGITNSSLTFERSLADGLGESLKKSTKASYSVSKVMKSPLSVYNSSNSFSGSASNLLRRRVGSFGGVVESTSEESDDGSARISNPHRGQNVVIKKISSSKQDCTEISIEDSLHLRLSERLNESNKTNEKTVYTIGRDATSPDTLKNSPVDSPDNSSGKIIRTQKSRHVRRIIDSDSESEEEIGLNYKDRANHSADSETLPNLEIQSYKTSSGTKSERISQINSVESGDIHIYNDEQRRNMGAVLKSVNKDIEKCSTRQQKFNSVMKNKVENKKEPFREVKDNVQRNIVFETDSEGDSEDEDSVVFQERETSSEEEEDYKKTRKDNDAAEDVLILTQEKHRALVDESFSSSESENKAENDSFEVYLKSVKKQIDEQNKHINKIQDQYETSFINDDSDEDDSYSLPPLPLKYSKNDAPEPTVNYKYCGSITTDLRSYKKIEKSKKTITSTSSSSWRDSPTVNISSDSDEVFSGTEVRRKPTQPSLPIVTPKPKGRGKTIPKTEGNYKQVSRRYEMGGNCNGTPTLSFLASLSTNKHFGRCHPEALVYTKNFKKTREHLSEKLYQVYNNLIFESKLPPVMNIKWNARMTKTAGFCYYQIDKSKPSGRGARIELSMKVIDSNERLRDTLIHELCHAAAWIISGYKDGHGPLWKAWAAQATHKCPELPAINRCHSYEISCKYTYRCSSCSYSIGRHSKSLDTEKKVCGYCHGKFELIVNSQHGGQKGTGRGNHLEVNGLDTPAKYIPKTPRTPGAFALFVKGNYGTVKKSGQNLKHADVMKVLSTEFGKMKAGSN